MYKGESKIRHLAPIKIVHLIYLRKQTLIAREIQNIKDTEVKTTANNDDEIVSNRVDDGNTSISTEEKSSQLIGHENSTNQKPRDPTQRQPWNPTE